MRHRLLRRRAAVAQRPDPRPGGRGPAPCERQGEGRFHFKLTTNGLLLDEAFLHFALEEDILIAMSLDGVREAHDRHRRLPDGSPSFDRLLPKLRMLLAARPYASVLMVVNPDTVTLLDRVGLASCWTRAAAT